jgi:hypothetical protein
MNPEEQLKFAGDYKLHDVKIGSARGEIYDVFNFVIDINIYEDIYSPTMSGNLTLNDAQDLINLLPMIGEEKLLITFQTAGTSEQDGNFEQEFYIYKMTDRKYTAERAIQYTLHFASFETVRDVNSKIGKGYTGNIDDNVKLIVKKELATEKRLTVEETKNTCAWVSNYWSPFTNLNFLTKRAISKETGSANFVFFENNRGFYFVSIDTFLEQSPKAQYVYDNNSRDPSNNGGADRDIAQQLGNITSFTINTAYDYMTRIQSGMYKSRLITHELVTKTYNIQTLDYQEEFPKRNHLNPYPLSTKALPSKTFGFLDVQPRALENFSNFKTDRMKNWYLKNVMNMAELNAFSIDITVPGRSNLCVGDIIEVIFYRPTPIGAKDTEEQIMDKTFSGRYLIGALCHNLNREKHEMHMTIYKDSLIIDLTKEGSE